MLLTAKIQDVDLFLQKEHKQMVHNSVLWCPHPLASKLYSDDIVNQKFTVSYYICSHMIIFDYALLDLPVITDSCLKLEGNEQTSCFSISKNIFSN